MSALGQKQTLQQVCDMSLYPRMRTLIDGIEKSAFWTARAASEIPKHGTAQKSPVWKQRSAYVMPTRS